jgi:FkbM family methyltransferase
VRNLLRSPLLLRSRSLQTFCANVLLPYRKIAPIELTQGLRMCLDLSKANQRKIFYLHEEYEPALQWMIRHLLPTGGLFVDCGANTGLFGLLAIFDRGARTIFVEPHPALAQMLRENIALNKFKGSCDLEQIAASDQPGSAALFEACDEQYGGHSLCREKASGHTGRSFKVAKRRLDDLLGEKRIARVDLLKVDCEWHDLEVLRGLGSFLQPERIPAIYVEMSGEQFDPIFELLTNANYSPFFTRKMGLRTLRRCAEARIRPDLFECAAARQRRRDLLWLGTNSDIAEKMRAELNSAA